MFPSGNLCRLATDCIVNWLPPAPQITMLKMRVPVGFDTHFNIVIWGFGGVELHYRERF